MTSEQVRQRSDLLGTQIITRDTGKRLGVISQLWVDIDRREVVALGLRDSFIAIASMPRLMLLNSIRQIGDVILVDDDTVLEEDIDIEAYSTLINSEVLTENGELLGRVRSFKFDPETGTIYSLIIASLGLPQIPDQVISTYELPIEEIVSSGPNRLIVFEGAQDRLSQLTVGVLERLGIGKAPWDNSEDEEYMPQIIRAENQIGTGTITRTNTSEPIRTTTSAAQEAWDEDEWQEPAPAPRRQAQPETLYYEEEEEDNWNQAPRRQQYQQRAYTEPPQNYQKQQYSQEYDYEEVEDAWADDESPKPYKPPKVNIPEKKKTPQYEEETNY